MKTLRLLFIVFFYSTITGQNTQPKVGLVLSGGGAKGFAHIGVLKQIDRAGLQLDYIGGTSMGAVIGGLYAAGYTADQIETIVTETDFINLLTDKVPRNSETFFEKEFGEKTIVTLPIEGASLGLPKAVSKGQNVLNLLLELLEGVNPDNDFSKLPVPFFCVATDIENGKPVVLEKGSLPIALRASGSFPSLLNPVEVNGKLLVDGGIANNFPVDVLKSKGIDIVIGVDVEGKLSRKDNINSVVSLLNQIVSYQMYNKSKEQISKLDVYIQPKIIDFSVVDFDKKDQILQIGNTEALKYLPVFKEIAKKQMLKKVRPGLYLSEKKHRITSIGVFGLQNYTRSYVLGKLNIKKGDVLTRKELTKKIYLLSATRNYNSIEYKLIKKDDETYRLNFLLKESKEVGNLKLGFNYDFLYKTSILAAFDKKNILNKNDLLSLDVILGDNLRYDLNYFVDNGFYTSYGFSSRYNHFTENSKFNLDPSLTAINNINLVYRDLTNKLFVQTAFERKFAIGLGLEHKWLKATTETLYSPTSGSRVLENSNYLNSYGFLKLDTYDKKYFVTKGVYADLNFKWYMSSSNFNNDFKMFSQARGTVGFATTVFNKLTIKNTNDAAFTFGNPTSKTFDFYLGGYNQNYINTFVPFYGYSFTALANQSFIKSQVDLQYKLASKHYLSFIANYARVETNVFRDFDLFDNIKSGYAVGYSYDSFLGPIEIKYSWTPDNNKSYLLFNLGYWF